MKVLRGFLLLTLLGLGSTGCETLQKNSQHHQFEDIEPAMHSARGS